MEFRRLYRTLRKNPRSAIATGLGAVSIISTFGSLGWAMYSQNYIDAESYHGVLNRIESIDNRINSLRSVDLDLLQGASLSEINRLAEERKSQISNLNNEREKIVSSNEYQNVQKWKSRCDNSMTLFGGSSMGTLVLMVPSLLGWFNLKQQYTEPNSATHYGGMI